MSTTPENGLPRDETVPSADTAETVETASTDVPTAATSASASASASARENIPHFDEPMPIPSAEGYPGTAPYTTGSGTQPHTSLAEVPINRTPRAFTIVWGVILLGLAVLLVSHSFWRLSIDPIALVFTIVAGAGVILLGIGIGIVLRGARRGEDR
ncbi:hypothetical protein D9V32_12010 [Mycetocola tolaasinivorans]|uniref:Uncharacterized protein n=1 Tax=Mycetocola tolaasinivorans TaxID=76635 RepID=A0A3L7A3G5_9MICO|nr:hypothetical protein [Mycetocola tolaasinivorans]RLP74757.1 hypothetical protein D9V32_12010 [Mycetocola tolaasinivorans]